MKRSGKIVLWILGIIAAMVIIIAVGIAMFFPKEKAKAMAIEKISAMLERKVTVDDVSISFWGGLGVYLEGIKISNPAGFENSDFLSARALDVKINILPLLKKDIQIDRLILKEPRVNLHKLPGGQNNYKFGAAESAAQVETGETLSDESKVAAMAISFENMTIEKGHIEYADDSSHVFLTADGLTLKSRMTMPSSTAYNVAGNLEIDSLKMTRAGSKIPTLNIGVEFDGTADLKAGTVVVSDSKIKVNGLVFNIKAGIPNIKTMAYFNVEAAGEKNDLQNIISLLPDSIRNIIAPYSISGQLSFKANAKYNKSSVPALVYNGQAAFTDLKLAMKDIKGELLVNSARIDFKNDFVKLGIEKASYEGNPLEGTIAVSNFGYPQIDAGLKGIIDMAILNPFLPKTGNPNLSGSLQFDIAAKGAIKDLTQMSLAGALTITDGSYTAATLPEPVQSFSVDLKMTPQRMVINSLKIKFPSSDITLSGTMDNAFPYILPKYAAAGKKPSLAFTLKSERFDTDKLFPEAVPGSGVNRASLPADSVPPLLLPDINGDGTGTIDTLVYSKVEFTKITAKITIRDRKILIGEARGNVYSGRVTGETEVDLNDFDNPGYSGKFEATQIEANDFLTRFSKFGGHLYGKLNLNGDFSAHGWEPEPFMNSLTMDGLGVIKEAKLVNFGLLKQLAQNLHFKTLDEETINDVASSIKIANGRIVFDALKFLSGVGDWNVAGSIGFDGSLDYSGEVLLSDKVSGELMAQSTMVSQLASLFKESQSGRIKVPFKLGGSYASPAVSIDLNAKNKVKDNLKGKIDSAIQDLLKKK
jgi:uncharacterized protein involved in outer membrane biogenesis